MSDRRQNEACPTCGTPVVVVSGDEGTSHYQSLYEFDVIVPLGELREQRNHLRDALRKIEQLSIIAGEPGVAYANIAREALGEEMVK
jgi:hypothetical protein